MRAFVCLALACVVGGCSGGSASDGGGPPTLPTADGGGMVKGTACTATFGGDGAGVTVQTCTTSGPFLSGGVASLMFSGTATGLVGTPAFAFAVKLPSDTAGKTYSTTDVYDVDDAIGLASTNQNYYVTYDARTPSNPPQGSVRIAFTSPSHGTVDATYVAQDPSHQATLHIDF